MPRLRHDSIPTSSTRTHFCCNRLSNMNWLKHAFGMEPEGAATPTAEQQVVIEKLAAEVVRRRMTTPALAFLEMSRPLSFLGSQALHFFAPILSALTVSDGHRHFAEFMERRGAIDTLCREIERQEQLAESKELPGREGSESPEGSRL
ncbi:MAG: hypothetical protein R3C01_04990 [Planctomycetaceae bacterium]